MPPLRVALLACLLACSRTGVAIPETPSVDAGTAAQWSYENSCRALADYFLVQETADSCVIATFADRLPPSDGETRVEPADVTRGPGPCPPPGGYVEGYPAQRGTFDVEVRRRGLGYAARIEGRFADGTAISFDFASDDARQCCACWGTSWPVRP